MNITYPVLVGAIASRGIKQKTIADALNISRAHGGLGIEQNIVTLCHNCHRRYDQSISREVIGSVIADYLRTKYKDWDPVDLIYRKGM